MGKLSYRSPLYIQLREVIRSKIEEGEYPPGTAIPSENQLAVTYGLNRVSVRSALAALENEGLITAVQGKGMFVNGPKTERDLESLGGYRQTMNERGKDASTRVLVKAAREAGPYYARLLELAPEDQIWFIRRVDYSGGEPVALEEIYIPCQVLPGLEEIDLGLFSIYDAYIWNGVRPDVGSQVLRITTRSEAHRPGARSGGDGVLLPGSGHRGEDRGVCPELYPGGPDGVYRPLSQATIGIEFQGIYTLDSASFRGCAFFDAKTLRILR